MRLLTFSTQLLAGYFATVAMALSCSAQPPSEVLTSPHRLTVKELPNPVSICDKVMSGGLPNGDAAFAQLAEMGIKTIISVDGAKPDVATAEKHGLRYIHLPHGYDGIPKDRIVELAKAVTELEGPIYVHCHHGKHRSPAAAAAACVAAGLIDSETGEDVLRIAGTSAEYRGLFQSVKETRRISAAQLSSTPVHFQAIAELPPMAEMMVDLEHAYDHLRTLDSSDWPLHSQSAATEAAHSALMLEESLKEILRVAAKADESEGYLRILNESIQQAQVLRQSLAAYRDNSQQSQLETASQELKRISLNCKACHTQYRDIPLGEKLKR